MRIPLVMKPRREKRKTPEEQQEEDEILGLVIPGTKTVFEPMHPMHPFKYVKPTPIPPPTSPPNPVKGVIGVMEGEYMRYERIGHGSYADVYRASRDGEWFALKIHYYGHAFVGLDRAKVMMAHRELMVMERLRDRQLVPRLFDHWESGHVEEEEYMVLVMELMETDLAKYAHAFAQRHQHRELLLPASIFPLLEDLCR